MTVASVDRAFQLLRAVPLGDGTLSTLSRDTGLPVATVSRLMHTLESAGAVRRDDKAYRIGPTIVELGTDEAAPYDLLSVAGSHLSELAAETNETAGIAESVGNDLIHLGQIQTEHDVAVKDWTGFRVGAHSGSIGFVLMAYWPDQQIADYLASGLERYVEQTVVDAAVIQERLIEIRARCCLWTTDEYSQGVTTVAAPIRDRSGAAVAALHVHGPTFRFPVPADIEHIETNLIERAVSISAVIGWNGDSRHG